MVSGPQCGGHGWEDLGEACWVRLAGRGPDGERREALPSCCGRPWAPGP